MNSYFKRNITRSISTAIVAAYMFSLILVAFHHHPVNPNSFDLAYSLPVRNHIDHYSVYSSENCPVNQYGIFLSQIEIASDYSEPIVANNVFILQYQNISLLQSFHPSLQLRGPPQA